MITNRNYNVDLASFEDKKLIYDFAKNFYFDVKASSKKTNRDKILIKLLKSQAIMASGISTIFLSSYLDKLCDRLKLSLQEKQAGSSSNIFNGEIVAIVDKYLVYNSISKNNIKSF